MSDKVDSNYDNDKLIEIFNSVVESEKTFPVWQWKVNGLYIWPLLSIRLLAIAGHHFHTQRVKLDFGPRKKPEVKPKLKRQSKLSKGWSFLGQILKRLFKRKKNTGLSRHLKEVTKWTIAEVKKINLETPTPDTGPKFEGAFDELLESYPSDIDAFFMGNTTASYKLGDVVVQQLVDPFRLEEESRGLKTINLVVNAFKDTPMLNESWLNGEYPFGEVQTAVGAIAAKIPLDLRSSLPKYKAWEDYICKKTGLSDLGADAFYEKETKAAIAYVEFFRALFKKCKNIKKVYQVCYYGPIGYALNFVCRENDIPVIDIQHGVQGRDHRPYYFPNIVAGRENLLPTHFYNWTKEDSNIIESWSKNVEVQSQVVGLTWQLFLEALENSQWLALPVVKSADPVLQQIHLARNLRDQNITPGGLQRQVLLTTHPGEKLEWLPEFFLFCEKNNILLWWRLHPGDLKTGNTLSDAIALAAGFPVIVEPASKIPLPLLLEKMDLHVTKFSSTVIEANAFGVPTITYSKQGIMFYEETCSGSGLHYIKDTAALGPKIIELKPGGKPVETMSAPQSKVTHENL